MTQVGNATKRRAKVAAKDTGKSVKIGTENTGEGVKNAVTK